MCIHRTFIRSCGKISLMKKITFLPVLFLLVACDPSIQNEEKEQQELIYLKCESNPSSPDNWFYIFEMFKPLEVCESDYGSCRWYGDFTGPMGPTRTVGDLNGRKSTLINNILPRNDWGNWEYEDRVTTDFDGYRYTSEKPGELYFQMKYSDGSLKKGFYISVDRTDLSAKMTHWQSYSGPNIILQGSEYNNKFTGQCSLSNEENFTKEYERVYDFREQTIKELKEEKEKANKELQEKRVI